MMRKTIRRNPDEFEESVLHDLKDIRSLIEEIKRDSELYSEQADTIIKRVRKLERLVQTHRHKL